MPRRRAEIEVDGDAGVEIDAVEHAGQRCRRRVKAKAVGADRTGEDQNQAGRAVFQIVERLRVGGRRIGMIDALHHRPGRARRAAGERLRGGGALVERLDGQAVIGLALKPLERRALEHGIDQLAPIVARRWRKIAGERQGFSGSVIAAKCHAGPRRPTLRHRAKGVPPDEGLSPRRQLLDAACVHARQRVADLDARRSRGRARFRQAAPGRRRARTGADAAASGPGRGRQDRHRQRSMSMVRGPQRARGRGRALLRLDARSEIVRRASRTAMRH